jgi:hypothetical protein
MTRPSRRHLIAASAGLLLGGAMAAVSSVHSVAASSSGCTFAYPQVCVGVHGTGLHVTEVDGGLILRSRQSYTGYWTIVSNDGQINIKTATATYNNQSYVHPQSYNSGWIPVNRDLPNGTKVCSTFNASNGPLGTACVTIHP